jgi:2,3-bisphosphoglycerate-independent phosphoglycerate mutase
VTYFFDGEKEISDPNYTKILIPSPQVPTYDLKPEMSVGLVTEETLKAIEEDYDFILVNFANPDMLGHTGNLKAAIDGIEMCDFCLGKIYDKAQEYFYDLLITADHGNAEEMVDKSGNIITSHTTAKVPFIICDDKYKIKQEGSLRDIVPTIINMYEIKKPDEMTGESLIIKEE